MEFLYIFSGIALVMLIAIVVIFISLRKKLKNADVVRIEKLRKGTKEQNFSSEVFYQNLYIKLQRMPFIRNYLFKIRRRLEINNLDDEFLTRLQSAKIIFKTLIGVLIFTIAVIFLTYKNPLIMGIILIFELFIIDTVTDGMVDKIDNKLLAQQIDFFGSMRHAYHETNMVGEAIYVTAQDTDNVEISHQAERIFEILNSSDPETELEKYYDVAPNNYLKEFAGISYLTQEFGDRKINNESLYLKNLENITQEMQLEILKRDKLNYVFQSLSVIAIVPILLLEPLKSWAVSNFSFTQTFYEGKVGMLIQILVIILTMISYILVRKLKDNGSTKKVQDNQNPWQEKVYKKPFIKKFVDMLIPKQGTVQERKEKKLLKDSASKQKLHWIYVSKVVYAIFGFLLTLLISFGLHEMQINFQYTNPTADYNLLSQPEGRELVIAVEKTKRQNKYLNMFKGKKVTKNDIIKELKKDKEYKNMNESDIVKEAEQIQKKLEILADEHLKWQEILVAVLVAYVAYMWPMILLKFQLKLRKMQMEDEVMQYQVIILMLMRLERVDVQMILEWLERYSDIFKDVISKCLNNYEAGAWEALEQMREDVTYQEFIRIIESLQSAVEKVPVKEAFEELDSDRDYYKDKRKEANERLIEKRGKMGKFIGFAPMITLFVFYLIGPLMYVGLTSMSETMNRMGSAK